MNTEEYLEWFRSNYDLMQRHFDGALLFAVNYDTTGWVAGYGFIEDYDGTYFLKNLRGESDAVFYALRESYEKTKLTIKKLSTIEAKLVKAEQFQKSEPYTIIRLNLDGGTNTRPVVYDDPETWPDGTVNRHKFFSDYGGILLYRPYQCKFIYPAIEQEMVDYLNA